MFVVSQLGRCGMRRMGGLIRSKRNEIQFASGSSCRSIREQTKMNQVRQPSASRSCGLSNRTFAVIAPSVQCRSLLPFARRYPHRTHRTSWTKRERIIPACSQESISHPPILASHSRPIEPATNPMSLLVCRAGRSQRASGAATRCSCLGSRAIVHRLDDLRRRPQQDITQEWQQARQFMLANAESDAPLAIVRELISRCVRGEEL